MILGEYHGEHFLAADKAQERELGAGHEFLDDNFAMAELVVQEHVLQRGLGFFKGFRDDDSLPRRESVVLKDHGE